MGNVLLIEWEYEMDGIFFNFYLIFFKSRVWNDPGNTKPRMEVIFQLNFPAPVFFYTKFVGMIYLSKTNFVKKRGFVK